jgi:hypothetical protein
MAKARNVTVFLWSGPVVVQRLGRADPDPTALELEAIASAWGGASSEGIRPTVRIIETMPSLRSTGVGAAGRPAGSPAR